MLDLQAELPTVFDYDKNFLFDSCNMKLNLDYLLEELWNYLALIRVYTKKPGQPPDFDDGLILRKGVTVEHVCHSIHRTLAASFKYALVWVCLIYLPIQLKTVFQSFEQIFSNNLNSTSKVS